MLRLLTCVAFLVVLPVPMTGQEPAAAWGHLKGQVVGPQGKGAQWAIVALVDPKDLKAALPVHPKVAATIPKTVVFDTPADEIVPRVQGVIEGQTVQIRNSSVVPHNV